MAFYVLAAIYISHALKCLSISLAHFLMLLFAFSLLSFEGPLYILNTNPLLEMWFAKYSPSL